MRQMLTIPAIAAVAVFVGWLTPGQAQASDCRYDRGYRYHDYGKSRVSLNVGIRTGGYYDGNSFRFSYSNAPHRGYYGYNQGYYPRYSHYRPVYRPTVYRPPVYRPPVVVHRTYSYQHRPVYTPYRPVYRDYSCAPRVYGPRYHYYR